MTLASIRRLVADDAHAYTFQTFGQYRTALLKAIDQADEVCELTPTSNTEVPGWQPIETAPKGRNVLVGYWNRLGNWRTVKGCYYPPQVLELHEDHDWDEDSDGYAPEGWYEETETHEVTLPLECEPARWMPLPAAPNALSQTSKEKQ